MKRRLLFVDDDSLVLQAMVRSLRSMRNQRDVATAAGAEEALQKLASEHFDVVISDMRMPGMDGAMLLNQIKIDYPQVLRFVLSGQCDQATMLRSVSIGHQFLSKPCDVADLKAKLAETFSAVDLLDNEPIKRVVSQLRCVPQPA